MTIGRNKVSNEAPYYQPRETAQPAPAGAQFTVHAVLRDFRFSVQFTGDAEKLQTVIERLIKLGAKPS